MIQLDNGISEEVNVHGRYDIGSKRVTVVINGESKFCGVPNMLWAPLVYEYIISLLKFRQFGYFEDTSKLMVYVRKQVKMQKDMDDLKCTMLIVEVTLAWFYLGEGLKRLWRHIRK